MMTIYEIKNTIRNPFLYKNGYSYENAFENFFHMYNGDNLCTDCAKKEFRKIVLAAKNNALDRWRVFSIDNVSNYDTSELILDCVNCRRVLKNEVKS